MKKLLKKHANKIYLLVVFLIYISTLRGIPGNPIPNTNGQTAINTNKPPFETSMERGRYTQIVSFSLYHKVNIDQFSDFLKPDLAWYNGHYFSPFPPGVAILLIPAYLIGYHIGLSQVITYATAAIYSIIVQLIIIKICQKLKFSQSATLFAAFIFGLGSVVWPYSVTLSAHPFSALLIALETLIYLSVDNQKSNWKLLLIMWFTYALGIFIDYTNLVIVFPILLFTMGKTIKKTQNAQTNTSIKIPLAILYTTISAILIAALFITYNQINYHRPIVFTNTFNLRPLEQAGIPIDQKHLNNNIFQKKPYATRFNLNKIKTGAYTLLLSEDRGLFFFTPLYLLSILGCYLLAKKKQNLWIITIAVVALDVLIYGAFDDPWGGWGFGPRYMIVSMPLLAIAMANAFDYLKNRNLLFKLLLSLATIYCVTVALLGAITTNAIPPSVEAKSLNSADNFIQNAKLIQTGELSSFIFNQYLKLSITPLNYFLIIESAISTVGLLIIWLPSDTVSRKSRKEINHV